MTARLLSSDLFLVAQSDERLAALAGDGHGRAFAILLDRHRRPLLGHARRMVGTDRAEDVLQQALLRAWRSLQAGGEIRGVQAWLHRIVHNASLNEIERQIETFDPLDENFADHRSVATTAEQRFEVAEVLQSVANLSQRQRLALLGTELEGRSRRQLAAELGLSEGAVRQLVHRARTQVRAAVAAIVPFPLVYRAMRNAGWVHASAPAGPLRSAAEAASASGALAAGVAKVATIVVAIGAAGAVGERVLLRPAPARAHVAPAVTHRARTTSGTRAAPLVSSRATAAPLLGDSRAGSSAVRLRLVDSAGPSAAPHGADPRRRSSSEDAAMRAHGEPASGSDGEAATPARVGSDGSRAGESESATTAVSDGSAPSGSSGSSSPSGSSERTDSTPSTVDGPAAPGGSTAGAVSPSPASPPPRADMTSSDLLSPSGD